MEQEANVTGGVEVLQRIAGLSFIAGALVVIAANAPHPRVVRFRLGRYGGTTLTDPGALHYTRNSPYVAVCLAAHMGAARIVLIGVDFTDHHFFARTGRHALAPHLATIDAEYRRLGDALRERGIDVVNASATRRYRTLNLRQDGATVAELLHRDVVAVEERDEQVGLGVDQELHDLRMPLRCGPHWPGRGGPGAGR